MSEIWRECPDFPNYEVSDSGAIRNIDTGRILRQSLAGPKRCQYYSVTLHCSGRSKSFRTNRLILLAHIGPPPADKPVCRHLDGDRWNNHLKNLTWGTYSENQMDKISHGTDDRGEKSYRTNITNEEAASYIARHQSGESAAQIARSSGIAFYTIQHMVYPGGHTWRHLHIERTGT